MALLCISTAIASIPVGLPTFVQTMLSSGAQRLAESKAVVKSLADVETLGGTTVINSDKTGTLTLNQMTATTMLADGDWFRIEGGGYSKTGAILGVAGSEPPDFGRLALGLTLCSDATVADDESIIGDPTEAALVVLAAKMSVDAEQTRNSLPRRAEVPFDSEYKFMATFHDRPDWLAGGILDEPHFMTVKGAPDMVVGPLQPRALARRRRYRSTRCARRSWPPISSCPRRGCECSAFAARDLDDGDDVGGDRRSDGGCRRTSSWSRWSASSTRCAPRPRTRSRPRSKAGIDVRMITGDHTVTARAIADELGLGPGVLTGTSCSASPTTSCVRQLPNLHVFGRVAPEDKLRLAKLMQQSGDVVAMTGDAVNDAAALKQADIGVAMGSGSEVSKQAAKIVLTDDNFATLVRAVDLGRDIYRRITSYVKLQLTICPLCCS